MKKYAYIALALTLCLGMGACSMRRDNATANTTNSATEPSVVTLPTLETNIPDPTVDGNSTEDGGLMGQITETTEETTEDTTEDTTESIGQRMRRRMMR